MFADDLRSEFYMKIKGQKVLVIVNYDIDAICACKILQSLFNTDYIIYTLVPVDLNNDLKAAYKENHLDEKYVILLNCGGTIDIVEELELEPDEEVTFFILDSHRPIDVCNIYNTSQIILLSQHDESEAIPNFEDIFREDSDEENEEPDDDNDLSGDEESGHAKRQRLQEEAILKRREKRKWEENRDKLMFEYSQYSYYGRSAALTIYELAWKLSKDNFDLLWYGIIGLSEQTILSKINEDDYVSACENVQIHVNRLTHRSSQLADEGKNTAIRIDFNKDLRLALLRHWTIKSSLMYSVFSATRFKLWTFRGERRLHEMLAQMGIPLTQCNQKFSAMELLYRREFHESIIKQAEPYNLEGIEYGSFILQHGFNVRYSASDLVYGLIALLQSTNKGKPKVDCFLECLEALSRSKKEKLDQALDKAKKLFVSIFKQVQSALEMKQIQSSGVFLYFVIQQGCVDPMICYHPYALYLLAEFALKAYCSNRKNAEKLPLVLCTPYGQVEGNDEGKEEEGMCHVVAIAPLAVDSTKTFFGKAFEKAAADSRTTVRETYFDSSVILINAKDRDNFLKALTNLLS